MRGLKSASVARDGSILLPKRISDRKGSNDV